VKKGIYLQATVQAQGDQTGAVTKAALQEALEGTHDGLTMEVKRVRRTGESTQVIFYVRGEQEPAADFAQWTTDVMRRRWETTLGDRWPLAALVERDDYLTEEEEDEEDQEAVAPALTSAGPAGASPDAASEEPARAEPVPAPLKPSAAAPSQPARARPKARKLRPKKKHWPWGRRRRGK
jgi:hypothetical protein